MATRSWVWVWNWVLWPGGKVSFKTMTESFLKRTLWSGSSSTGTEVGREVCCATSMVGKTSKETRPIFTMNSWNAVLAARTGNIVHRFLRRAELEGCGNGRHATLRAQGRSLAGTHHRREILALLAMTVLGKLQQKFGENWQSRRDIRSKEKRDSSLAPLRGNSCQKPGAPEEAGRISGALTPKRRWAK